MVQCVFKKYLIRIQPEKRELTTRKDYIKTSRVVGSSTRTGH